MDKYLLDVKRFTISQTKVTTEYLLLVDVKHLTALAQKTNIEFTIAGKVFVIFDWDFRCAESTVDYYGLCVVTGTGQLGVNGE